MKAKNRITACTLCLLALLALCLPARADYHYASHEGSNEYPYTSWETAANQIQDAVNAASPHDTVYVGAGDYYGRVVTSDTLSLIGMSIDSTRIWWDIYGEYVIGIGRAGYLSDLLVEHTASYVNTIWGGYHERYAAERCHFEGGGAYVSNAGGYIRNCIFNGPRSSIGGPLTGSDYLEVSNCYFYTTYRTPIWSSADTNIIVNNIILAFDYQGGEGIRIDGESHYCYVANNLIVLWGPVRGIMMNAGDTSSTIVMHNTIDTLYRWQSEAWYGVQIWGSNASLLMRNNSITGGEEAGVFAWHNLIIYASYNNIWGTDQWFEIGENTIIDTSEGILHEYPMFDKDNDYRLQAFSPLIDAGDPDILDVDGTRSDIGCYGGPGGCSYTYLDLAPLIPDSINATIDTNVVTLIWHMNEEADFNHYQIFRDTVSGFEPTIFDIIAETDTSFYIDADIEHGVAYYYRLTSVDNQGNVSDYSDEVAVIPTYIPGFVDDGLPKYAVIESAYPNPANSQVTIVYSASNLGPQPPLIELKIFDVQGRIVKTLVDEKKPAGTYRVIWDGANDHGEPVASGTYIVKVFQWYQDAGDYPVKITLVK